MALNVHKLGVVILTPETVGSFGVRAEARCSIKNEAVYAT